MISIRQEPIHAVVGRYEEFDLQPGGRPADVVSRLSGKADDTLSGIPAEPSGSAIGARPVCAIYYSNRLKGGDDKVILAELKRDWVARYYFPAAHSRALA